MNIRLYSDTDREKVISLWTLVFPATRPHHDPALSIDKKLARDADLFFIAEHDDDIAGTVMAGYDGHRGWIYSLAVDTRYRHRGIGRYLVDHAVDALGRLGCLKVNLQITQENSQVTEFYEKMGFSVESRISMGKMLYTESQE